MRKKNGTVGDLMRSIRKKLKVTQGEFAKRYGVPLGTVRNWEQQVCDPEKIGVLFLRLLESEPDVIVEFLKRYNLLC